MDKAVREYLETSNNDEVIELHFELKRLHLELSALYRMKSKDTTRINLLWREIEKREYLLRLNGVEVA